MEPYPEIIDFSGDSLLADPMKIVIALARISASGNSRPRNKNGMSWIPALGLYSSFKVTRHTEGILLAYVVCGHALITEIKATREAVCSVASGIRAQTTNRLDRRILTTTVFCQRHKFGKDSAGVFLDIENLGLIIVSRGTGFEQYASP